MRFYIILTLTSLFLMLGISPLKADYQVDLDTLQYVIKDQEAQFSDIVEGSEKHIRWYKNSKQKTELAFVYLHGFSASRQELSPTTERLADQFQANAFYARLQGHGRSDDAMGEATVQGWKNDAKQAYLIGKKLADKVIVVSTSTGGTLATWLAAQPFASDMLANIMISPNYDVASSLAKIVTWPGGLTIARWIEGDYHSFTPMSEAHDRYWTNRYPIEAILPMFELLDEVQEQDKSGIKSPQLMIYSPDDKVIDIDAIERTAKEFSSANVELELFTKSTDPYQHVLSGDACSADSTDAMIQLLSDHISKWL